MIGSGMIATVFLNTFQGKSPISVEAIWCFDRHLSSTKELAEKFGIKTVESNIDRFLENDSFDTVYVALVNNLHYEFAKKALNAGKNVFCEKPFTTTYAQAKELYDLAREKGLMLLDCIPARYSENLDAVKEAIGKIGDVKIASFFYTQYSRRYDRYLAGDVQAVFSVEKAGGALYDLNVYNLSVIEHLLGTPENYKYYPNIGFNGIDVSGMMILDYGDTKVVSSTAKDCAGQQQAYIQGTKGFIRIQGIPSDMRNIYLKLNGEEEVKIDVVSYEDSRKHMFERISDLIENKETEKSYELLEKTLHTMKIMENARKEAGIFFGEGND